jgi:tetraacyldisaccharide 4'-kinase
MNMFYDFFLRSFRLLLLPFSLVYWLIIFCRNYLYDHRWIRSATFGLPLITVGNLTVGGTGKSPLIEWLVGLLSPSFQVATLSRGYRRRTKGYLVATPQSTALDIGDEPLSLFRKFPSVAVTVGENRLTAIPELLHDFPATEVILLDDAFQHRSIQAGLSILLTDYGNLFTRDFYLPTGDLRDLKSRYKAASIIVVTKCNASLSIHEKEQLTAEISPLPHQKLFFTAIEYGIPYHLISRRKRKLDAATEVLLVTGIANPKPLKKYIEESTSYYRQLTFKDHHIFSFEDWMEIETELQKLSRGNGIILTTEKDAVRLEKFKDRLVDIPIYVIPIQYQFLFNAQQEFENEILQYIKTFVQPR